MRYSQISLTFSRIANFLELLSSPDVDLRIAVGEAIVVLFENAIDNEGLEDEAFEVVGEAVVAMKELAKDSHKYRSKKDKKEQKSSFRDIIRYIDDNDEFYEKISFGHGESLEIDNWAQKKQFDALRKVRKFLIMTFRCHVNEGFSCSYQVSLFLCVCACVTKAWWTGED